MYLTCHVHRQSLQVHPRLRWQHRNGTERSHGGEEDNWTQDGAHRAQDWTQSGAYGTHSWTQDGAHRAQDDPQDGAHDPQYRTEGGSHRAQDRA
jgi:hypothetical protein